MYIKIYYFGKLKNQSLKELKQKYLILLSAWNVDMIELKESKIKDVPKKQTEDFKILSKNLNKNYKAILLDERGKNMTSQNFANSLEEASFAGQKTAFIIGPTFGFQEEDKSIFNEKIGLSKMTFTHEMAQIILLEQLYRAFSIINNKSYHY